MNDEILEVTSESTSQLVSLELENMQVLVQMFYDKFYVDMILIAFIVVGSISAVSLFWALRGR